MKVAIVGDFTEAQLKWLMEWRELGKLPTMQFVVLEEPRQPKSIDEMRNAFEELARKQTDSEFQSNSRANRRQKKKTNGVPRRGGPIK